ncbi:MAG: hypothetical protein JWR35_3664 [Marmoricola sp.]|nr:hypothetical protein [Marmoricola sp.]
MIPKEFTESNRSFSEGSFVCFGAIIVTSHVNQFAICSSTAGKRVAVYISFAAFI